jgi:hypothetical protein
VPISHCEARACAYNKQGLCCAVTVEIAKGDARCECFTRSVMFNASPNFQSQVNVCRMSGCTYNRLSGCTLEAVSIETTKEGAACRDFTSRTT